MLCSTWKRSTLLKAEEILRAATTGLGQTNRSTRQKTLAYFSPIFSLTRKRSNTVRRPHLRCISPFTSHLGVPSQKEAKLSPGGNAYAPIGCLHECPREWSFSFIEVGCPAVQKRPYLPPSQPSNQQDTRAMAVGWSCLQAPENTCS